MDTLDLFASLAPAAPPPDDLDALAQRLRDSGNYVVLSELRHRARYANDAAAHSGHALFVDVETTGLDAGADAIIELGMVPFTYGPDTGEVFGVDAPLSLLDDPGRPIPPKVVALTGIDDSTVRGQHIDVARVETLVGRADLILAHNAAFDRPFLERRIPAFARKPWACSQLEVPWRDHALGSAGLEYLLFKHGGVFMRPHRAGIDCLAGVHILATPFANGDRPLKLLLDSSGVATIRIRAEGSPFDRKDVLKQRGYRWFAGEAARPRCWWRDVPEPDAEAEQAWLASEVYGSPMHRCPVERIDAYSRYSRRQPEG